ncbi:hypothetical protein [Treponema sp. OMZ 792]|uniref:hypothetical protein n=1 Tax=Treponema sp. OMZ 792 TaxID=2563667 RepID=UPI0020A43885|nr:hypothetical protein [Treponema sp. OMZ 792]
MVEKEDERLYADSAYIGEEIESFKSERNRRAIVKEEQEGNLLVKNKKSVTEKNQKYGRESNMYLAL